MDTIESPTVLQLGQENRVIRDEVLSLGVDMDGRGLRWRLSKQISPQKRLEFALAVYFSHGLYVFVAADRGFLCVERIAQCFAQLTKARQSGSYLIGHSFARLLDALGYSSSDTTGLCLIEPRDCSNPRAFTKGFSDAIAQSMETNAARVAIRKNHAQVVEFANGEGISGLCQYLADIADVSSGSDHS